MSIAKIVAVAYDAPGYMTPRDPSKITDLIVHHTAGPKTQTPQEIDAEHRALGDSMIAYNFVIEQDGTISQGRPVDVVPAAAFGRNVESINVVLVGNFQKGDPGYTGPPTSQQMQSLMDLALLLHKQYPTIVRTIGHCDVAIMFYANDTAPFATDCPGSDLYESIPAVKRYVGKHLAAL